MKQQKHNTNKKFKFIERNKIVKLFTLISGNLRSFGQNKT